MANVTKKFTLGLSTLSIRYKWLILRTYLQVIPAILFRAKADLFMGLVHAFKGRQEEKWDRFLEGSSKWGEAVHRRTDTNLSRSNEIIPPEKGHLIFLNHVCEMDFPFDSLIMRKPYLANQVIKKTLFAYWWMVAMGSQVFDNRKARTIHQSVQNLLEGLKLRSFVVYPEGHNTYGEVIKPMRKGMIKIAYENNIPIFITVKSGIASFLEQTWENSVSYRYCKTIDNPSGYASWEELRDDIFETMRQEKDILDEEMRKALEAR